MRHAASLLVLATLGACAGQQGGGMRPIPMFAGIKAPLIIAHRGGSLEAPENTVAAVQHGVDAGADWVEIDVTLSSDEKVIVIHDDTVDRTTDGTGAVRELAASTLTHLLAGKPEWSEKQRERLAFFGVTPPDFGDRFIGAHVPTLEEVLAVPHARLMIEIKEIAPGKKRLLAQKTIDAIREAQAWDRVALGSFDADQLWAVHDLDTSLPLIGIAETFAEAEVMLGLPINVLAVRFDLVAEVKPIVPPKVALWSWTAYSVEMAKAAIEAGAHGVISDVPKQLVDVLRALPSLYLEDEPVESVESEVSDAVE